MIDWSKINTVFFDMDGTLLDLHFDNYFWLEHLPKRFTELKKIPHEQTLQKLHAMFEQYQGSLNWYCLDFWSDELGIDIVELKREVSDRIAYRPHVKQFLSALHEMGLELAILTNAHRGSIDSALGRQSARDGAPCPPGALEHRCCWCCWWSSRSSLDNGSRPWWHCFPSPREAAQASWAWPKIKKTERMLVWSK